MGIEKRLNNVSAALRVYIHCQAAALCFHNLPPCTKINVQCLFPRADPAGAFDSFTRVLQRNHVMKLRVHSGVLKFRGEKKLKLSEKCWVCFSSKAKYQGTRLLPSNPVRYKCQEKQTSCLPGRRRKRKRLHFQNLHSEWSNHKSSALATAGNRPKTQSGRILETGSLRAHSEVGWAARDPVIRPGPRWRRLPRLYLRETASC